MRSPTDLDYSFYTRSFTRIRRAKNFQARGASCYFTIDQDQLSTFSLFLATCYDL